MLPEPLSWLPDIPESDELVRGALLCRGDRHAEAVALLARRPDDPVAGLFRALAEHGRGQRDAARRALAEALALLPPEKATDPSEPPPTPLPWPTRVEVETLRKEVEASLRQAP